MKKMKKGFTIVELVIVIAVIAILAAVLIPTFTSVTEKAKESAALQEARNAYTNTISEALVDGSFADNDTDQSEDTITLVKDGYTFVLNADGELTGVTLTNGAYNYNVVGGSITGVTKKTN